MQLWLHFWKATLQLDFPPPHDNNYDHHKISGVRAERRELQQNASLLLVPSPALTEVGPLLLKREPCFEKYTTVLCPNLRILWPFTCVIPFGGPDRPPSLPTVHFYSNLLLNAL